MIKLESQNLASFSNLAKLTMKLKLSEPCILLEMVYVSVSNALLSYPLMCKAILSTMMTKRAIVDTIILQ